MRRVRGRPQFGAKPPQGGAGDGRGEILRQFAAGGDLDFGEHVGLPAPGKIARDNVRRQREAGPDEFLRYDRGRQRLAVDEHAVAIEDDHGSPDALAGLSGTQKQCGNVRYADGYADQHDESVLARIIAAPE